MRRVENGLKKGVEDEWKIFKEVVLKCPDGMWRKKLSGKGIRTGV